MSYEGFDDEEIKKVLYSNENNNCYYNLASNLEIKDEDEEKDIFLWN